MSQSAVASRKPLLGTIMLREGVIEASQYARALDLWQEHRETGHPVPFGQVVIALGMCTPAELAPCLRLQRKLATAPSRKKPLGHLLIENALLTPTQVALALRLQKSTGKPLGELLIAEEILREPQLEVLLRLQAKLSAVA
jgi:hypothetical protein